MKYTQEIEINVGNNVECLTADGWLQGIVREVYETSIVVYVEAYDEEQSFEPKFIRK
jgi:hypothetical protein